MHENHLPQGGKDQIWRAGKIRTVKAVSVPKPVQQTPHNQFGLGVFPPDSAHVRAALRGGEAVQALAP